MANYLLTPLATEEERSLGLIRRFNGKLLEMCFQYELVISEAVTAALFFEPRVYL